ncbi:hypothetical protein TcarDRAFT_1816 [Thermosinus carboxydivorans Nor1]|uniref:Uncharacterized protein n=1 Tax=Thermosinus carboxydivorans Nor1 TaxID=401526 RepID=A1HPE9_9FIRM|nr:hypothetical protein [Thermosinus carboxydivorans]EAX48269.1 hypothetical protein TcarDRAFT_1816 [Thermosinus carboxydivorans Nor1]
MAFGLNKRKPRERATANGEAATGKAKLAKPVKPVSLLRKIFNNPNSGSQLLVILLTLMSDNVNMDRRISTMTASIDKIRNVTELMNTTLQSLKTAAEVPNHVRKLLK